MIDQPFSLLRRIDPFVVLQGVSADLAALGWGGWISPHEAPPGIDPWLTEIERFVVQVRRMKELADRPPSRFPRPSNANAPRWGIKSERVFWSKYQDLLPFWVAKALARSPELRYSVPVEAFVMACDSHGFESTDHGPRWRKPFGQKEFDALIAQIRVNVRVPASVMAYKQRARDAARNYHSLEKYLDALMAIYPVIRVVRLELGYELTGRGRGIDALPADLRRFLRPGKGRPDVCQDRVGYLWKREFCERRGYFVHLILLFNGHHVGDGISVAQRMGQYWQAVVGRSMGRFQDCRFSNNRLKQIGIGEVTAGSKALDDFKNWGICYLTEAERYVALSYGDGKKQKSFGHGANPIDKWK